MYFAHQAFLDSGETGWFLGFPSAAAWQVYGVWFAGVVLVAAYSAGFRRYILSEDDERRFEELLRESGETRNWETAPQEFAKAKIRYRRALG